MPSYLVTGTRQNLGLAFVVNLAKDPENTVIALSRSPMPAINRVKEVRADLADLKSLQRAATEIDDLTGGSLDVLILNAAGYQLSHVPVAEGREEELGASLLEAFQTNTVGHFQLVSLLLPLLRCGSEKKIIHMTSAQAVPSLIRESMLQGRLPYAMTKGALDTGLIRLSNELRLEGFTVVSISPSCVHSPESARAKGQDYEKVRAMMAGIPGSSGMFSPEEGVEVLLSTISRMGVKDSGRVVGMWGTEDRWV